MPKLPQETQATKVKYVDFCNGARLVRVNNTEDKKETWNFINGSLSDLRYEIDLFGSEGCSFNGDNQTTF